MGTQLGGLRAHFWQPEYIEIRRLGVKELPGKKASGFECVEVWASQPSPATSSIMPHPEICFFPRAEISTPAKPSASLPGPRSLGSAEAPHRVSVY